MKKKENIDRYLSDLNPFVGNILQYGDTIIHLYIFRLLKLGFSVFFKKQIFISSFISVFQSNLKKRLGWVGNFSLKTKKLFEKKRKIVGKRKNQKN